MLHKNKKAADSPSSLLIRFSRGSRLLFLFAILCSLVSILLNFLLPQIVGFTVDNVIGGLDAPIPLLARHFLQLFGGTDAL
ncbi:MAG: hypothetical protein MJ075_07435, partial [Oscillospiraceae bacterium]|nr:hypothetical protein [Oscillospiraceae bacterium]